jgi:hypothetical protein
MSGRIGQGFRLFALVVALASVQPCLAQALVNSASVAKNQARPDSQRKRKVWTNEDLAALRKSSDVLMDQEIARKQAEKAAGVQPVAGDTAKHTLLPVETPKSVEEADRFIAEKKEEIAYQELTIETVKEKLAHAESDEAEHLKSAMKQLTTDQDTAKLDLKSLQAVRQQLSSIVSD